MVKIQSLRQHPLRLWRTPWKEILPRHKGGRLRPPSATNKGGLTSPVHKFTILKTGEVRPTPFAAKGGRSLPVVPPHFRGHIPEEEVYAIEGVNDKEPVASS
ncbi:hypothetical protein Q3G72_029367 [Acer saccharum]|nr:hypothetical protein Q3G72_029367 [Acer saccharum]